MPPPIGFIGLNIGIIGLNGIIPGGPGANPGICICICMGMDGMPIEGGIIGCGRGFGGKPELDADRAPGNIGAPRPLPIPPPELLPEPTAPPRPGGLLGLRESISASIFVSPGLF